MGEGLVVCALVIKLLNFMGILKYLVLSHTTSDPITHIEMIKILTNFFIILPISILGLTTLASDAYVCAPGTKQVLYTVKKDDTLGGIVCAFGVPPVWSEKRTVIATITKENTIEDPNLIFPGDKILLPFPCKEEVHASVIPTRKVASLVEPAEFNPYSQLSVLGTYDFYRIDSMSSLNQSQAKLLSAPGIGVNLGWEQFWSERFHSGVNASYVSVKMLSASQGTVVDGVHDLSNIEMYFSYGPTPWLDAKFSVGYESQLFSRSTAVGVATLDRIYQTHYGVSVTPTLIRRGNLSLATELGYSQSLPTSTGDYTIKKADRFRVAPIFRQKLDKMQLELKLEYQRGTQESSISTQKNTQVGLHFGVSFEVGK